jgi:hypothetical protein
MVMSLPRNPATYTGSGLDRRGNGYSEGTPFPLSAVTVLRVLDQEARHATGPPLNTHIGTQQILGREKGGGA